MEVDSFGNAKRNLRHFFTKLTLSHDGHARLEPRLREIRITDDTVSLALDLLALGFKVFPVDPSSKRPLLKNGFHGASDDPEQVATWYTGEYDGARIGVATGASGIVVADLDRKNGKNGFESVEQEWLELPATFTYATPSGGEHRLYKAPEGINLTGNADYKGLSGFDRRGGGSYIVYHSNTAPASLKELADAPEWLLDEANVHDAAAFGGAVADWIAEFGQGEPNKMVQDAIDRIPEGDISHSDMVADQYNMIRLGAEGNPGVLIALEALRYRWLQRDPSAHSTPQQEWDFKFDEALDSGIKQYGQAIQAIADLPDYVKTFAKLDSASIEMLVGTAEPKKHYFDTIKTLINSDLTDMEVATLVWSAPTVKAHAREWGIEYLLAQIADARTKQVEATAPRENPTATLEYTENAGQRAYTLLSENERKYIQMHPNMLMNLYLDYCRERVNVFNAPYHRANFWTIASLTFAFHGFIPYKSRTMGVNLFQNNLGESGTGKSESISLRSNILRYIFKDDEAYDIGSDVSIQALQTTLIERDNRASFFNADEAARVFKAMDDQKYLSGLDDALTNYYEGRVPPMLRTGNKDISGKTALTSFNIGMFGTPKRVTDNLSRDMFMSGFLARFIWVYGDPGIETDDRYSESQADQKEAEAEEDYAALELAEAFIDARQNIGGGRHPILATEDALERMRLNRKRMEQMLKGNENWEILEPSVKRLGDVIRKIAALLAMCDGTAVVETRHALLAIEAAEEWIASLVRVSADISASSFQREVDAMISYIHAQGGSISESKLAHRFRNVADGDPRGFIARVESAKMQGLLKKHDATNTRGVQWEINK